ncbi:MAG TPA: DUF6599 family protein [Bacteroidales bacterium]|nr:DUF6599 family protein [Bacteroidales bacterium]
MPELSGFKKLTNYPVFTPDNLWDFINGAADIYLAYGFIDLHVCEYKKSKDVIKLEIYQHKNSTLAFGIYSTERSSEFRFINLGTQGYSADGSLNFFKGNYYVKIRTYSEKEKTLQAQLSLAQSVAEMLPGETIMPPVLNEFPSNGKRQNEDLFIQENVLGHSFLTNAFRANYEVGSDIFQIYIIEKNTSPEILEVVNTYLKTAGLDNVTDDNGKMVFKDGYNGTIFLAWTANRIVIISGLAKDQSELAEQYTSEIFS